MVHPKAREVRVRRAAKRQGLELTRSRRRDPQALDFGRYKLVDDETHEVVFGDRWGVALDDVEAFLSTERSQR